MLTDEERQLWLFADPSSSSPAPEAADARVVESEPEPVPVPEHEAQILLFAEPVALREDVERAIAAARFDDAARVRATLREKYGPEWDVEDCAFLDALAPLSWDGVDLEEALRAWHAASAALATPARRRQAADAFFLRLADSIAPSRIAEHDEGCCAGVSNALSRRDRGPEVRMLVRDALLRGMDLAPDAIVDPVVRGILAEDGCARRLACLGAIRGAWRAPAMSAEEAQAWAPSEGPPEDDDDRAVQFWRCLRVEATLAAAEAIHHAARRRMKALDPELHAEHMRRR